GWNNTPATITFTCADGAGSGVPNCPAPVTFSYDGAGQGFGGVVSDALGHYSAQLNITVNIDTKPPTVSGQVSPAPNSAGWLNTPAIVGWSCSDGFNGSGVIDCPPPQTVATDGAGQTFCATVHDAAGNATMSQPVT